MLQDRAVDIVIVCLPNDLHAAVTIDAAEAGKHVICEKPLATNLDEAERMIGACRARGVMLALAEELCFVPKFVRVSELREVGALGKIFSVHQREQHGGPYSPWFFSRDQAGGGALMDMGCHSIEIARWVLGRPEATAVYARMSNQLHTGVTALEDHVSMMVEFEGGALAVLEPSWALHGGMESHLDVIGTGGALYTDLTRGTGMRMFSETGLADDPETRGWSTPDPDWLTTNGYVQELEHFVECARTGNTPRVTGEDGLAQLEIIHAAYESARTGCRVALPFRPKGVERAVDLWLGAR
jgi:predicted dehydrogenase